MPSNTNADAPRVYRTEQAAALLQMSPKALRMHIARGNIKPDVWGGRGRTKSHLFLEDTLLAFLGRGRAA